MQDYDKIPIRVWVIYPKMNLKKYIIIVKERKRESKNRADK